MVREEWVGLVVGHVIGEMVAGVAHEDGEEGDPNQKRVQDVVRPNRQSLPLRLQGVTDVGIDLYDR
jgi:hypothetical protein